MFPHLPSGVSDQRAADGNGHFLSGNRKTDTGNRTVPVPPDRYLLPATLLLPLVLGVEGALWAGPLADALAFITTLIMLKLYWKKI